LGYNVSQHGLTPAEAKVLAIRELRVPTNVSELRQVPGFMNYYCFIMCPTTVQFKLFSTVCC
jgi:hypothetical protein